MGADNYVVIGTKLDTKDFDRQIELVEDKLETLEEEYNVIKNAEPYERQEEDLKRIGDEIIKSKKELASLNKEKEKFNNIGFQESEKGLSGIRKSIDGVVKKVTKWSLALIGIRSIYSGIRSAMSTLTQSDEDLGARVEYIRWALANSIKPLIEWIIKAMYSILRIVGNIIQSFTGYNIFENSGIEDYQKAMNKSNKSAKELKRTLAGFDEMNVLSDNDSSSTSIGGGIGKEFDLKNLGISSELDKILKKILKVSKVLLPIFAVMLKMKKLGLGIALIGLLTTIQNVIKWLENPTFENFMGILEGITMMVVGIATAFGLWPVAIGGAIALVVVELVKHWNTIKGWFSNLLNWINTEFRSTMEYLFGPIGTFIVEVFYTAVHLVMELFGNLAEGIKRIYDGIIAITRGDFVGGLTEIFGGILQIITAPFTSLINVVKGLWERIKKPIEDFVNKIKKALGFSTDMTIKYSSGDGGKTSYGGGGSGGGFRAKGGIYYPKLALGGIINMPGSGIPYHGATIGERGAEAVVPLTDSQQMALLGEAIGRYITVQLTNVTELDGRTIARKVQEVRNNDNFLMNR